jgi:hypothetical protein
MNKSITMEINDMKGKESEKKIKIKSSKGKKIE